MAMRMSVTERGGEGKENKSGDMTTIVMYSAVFASLAGICGRPMKLKQPCDIAEHYVT